tara:strand:- start:39 stop:182 length:144 start_codon:yes stop_codon:yes gene_type:complete
MNTNDFTHLHDYEIELIAEGWASNDYLNRYEDLDDTIFVDFDELPVL